MSERKSECSRCSGAGGDPWDGPCTDCRGEGVIPAVDLLGCDDEYDDADDVHDTLHPWMFAGCDDCTERADWLERQRNEATR